MKERVPLRFFSLSLSSVLGSALGLWGSGLYLFGCSSEVHFSAKDPAAESRDWPPPSHDAVPVEPQPSVNIPEEEAGATSSATPWSTIPLESRPVAALEQTFKAAEILEGEASLAVAPGILTQNIALRSNEVTRGHSFRQVDRPLIARFFKQGNPGSRRVETFTQESLGVLDLQIVIDNSGSMAEEQENLARRLMPLLKFFNSADWRINIITTDPEDTCSRILLRSNDPDLEGRFRRAILAGTSGSSKERGILRAVEGLSCPIVKWVRRKSAIGVLIVSDEDNCSKNGQDCDAPYNSHHYLLDYLKNNLRRTLGKDARVYGLIWKPGTSCPGAFNPGQQYFAAIEETNGQWGSICDSDYTPTLLRMSEDLAGILKRDFNLAAIPDDGTVSIKVNGSRWTGRYILTRNLITFEPMPPQGATIEVSYQTGATPILSRFPLDESPATSSMEVRVNGQRVPPEAFSYDREAHELVFPSHPPFDADVAVEFRQDTPLLTRFPLDHGVSAESLLVKVNGAPIMSGYSVESGGNLVFEVPPPDGVSIEASYRVRTGPVLEYALSQVGADARLISVTDADSGQRVRATLRNGDLVVDQREHWDGRKVAVKIKADHSGYGEVPLPLGYIPNSAQVFVDQGHCSVTAQELKLILNCEVPSEATVHMSWKYHTPPTSEFVMPGVYNGDQGLWTVSVDGRPTSHFVRRGSMIKVLEPLMPTSVVVIRFRPNP